MRHILCILVCLLSLNMANAQSTKGTTPVINATVNEERFKLYPAKAGDFVNIYVEWPEMQAFTIAIYDSKDLLQHEWKERPTKSYQKAVSLDLMPEGSYYIIVKGAKEAYRQAFSISRTK